MVEVADRAAEAAWKIRNLEDFDRRLERAARRVDERSGEGGLAAMVVYEAALMKSGRPREEVREMVRSFRATFEDEEEPLTISHASGIMNVEGDDWFFGDGNLRVLTGQLLGQFQHRVAQYNYVAEPEVLRRWADSYDTRLFIRRRIHETEPIAGVISGVDLPLIQYLRVAAGGDTLVPFPEISSVLVALGVLDQGEKGDDYAVLAAAESLALRLELPAPVVGEMLHDLGVEGRIEFPEPPPEAMDEEIGEATEVEDGAGTGGTDGDSDRPSPDGRSARQGAQREGDRGEGPTRIQDPQAKDAPSVHDEGCGVRPTPATPENEPPKSAPGTQGDGP